MVISKIGRILLIETKEYTTQFECQYHISITINSLPCLSTKPSNFLSRDHWEEFLGGRDGPLQELVKWGMGFKNTDHVHCTDLLCGSARPITQVFPQNIICILPSKLA